MNRWGLAALAWIVAAVLTTFVGIAAVESLGNGILGSPDKPLTRGDVASQLASSPEPSVDASTASPSPTAPESPSASATPSRTPTKAPASNRVLTIDGGTVLASCSGGLVTLLSWSPAQGYHLVKVERGPAKTAEIRFGKSEESEDHDSRLIVSCRDGRPVAISNGESGHE